MNNHTYKEAPHENQMHSHRAPDPVPASDGNRLRKR